MVTRDLAPDTPLRGPRAAVGWLFELACPAVHPPRLEEGREGRMVGILGGAGGCNLPPAQDSLKTPTEWETTPLPQNPTEANAVRGNDW